MSVEVMKQALEVLEQYDDPDLDMHFKAVTALRQAIEQAEKQEPVAWTNSENLADLKKSVCSHMYAKKEDDGDLPLYAAPPQREWVGLTDDEIAEAVGSPVDEVYLADFRKVVAKLRQKNAYGWQSIENPSKYLDELRGGEDD